MDVTNGILCWTPNTADVAVVPWPDEAGFSEGFGMTALGCWNYARHLEFEERKALVFVEAMHLIVRDKMPADAVHAALWVLDEYRDGCAEDMPIPNV
ncbi:MAG: hypothetical protein HS110_07850 [Zoogloeaceae bacterium]|nr:hypothetical protein [Zoogloeaceae bacterium]